MVDYPYNFKTFAVKALSDVDQVFRINGLSPNRDATLVLATPGGLALEPYHSVLLAPYSKRPLITMAELGRRGMEGLPADWSGEGIRMHCYKQLVACQLNQYSGSSPTAAAATVVSNLGNLLPRDPLGFAPPASPPPGVAVGADAAAGGSSSSNGAAPQVVSPTVLRVVIEARSTPWRAIRNVDEILKACQEAAGFAAGRFTSISCKALPASYDAGPAEPGSIPPNGPAAALFRSTLGAVRSAHLFVALAGSSGAHAFFMDPRGPGGSDENGGPGVLSGADRPTGGSGFLEVRPCGWGSEFASRADAEQDSMALQLHKGGDDILFFAYNVEDPRQCSPPDYAGTLQAALASGALKPQDSGHVRQQKPAPRYTPAELLVRDQHVTLRPAALLAMIRHAASLLSDKAAYQAARASNKLHGYGVQEGVLLGPAGLRDARDRAATGPPELIRA